MKARHKGLIIVGTLLGLLIASYVITMNGLYPVYRNVQIENKQFPYKQGIDESKNSGELRICGPIELSPKGEKVAIPVIEVIPEKDSLKYYYLYLIDLESKSTPKTVIKNAGYAKWSTDGNTIAFSRQTEDILWSNVTASRICEYSLCNGKLVEVGNGFVDHGPVWASNKDELAFIRLDYVHFEQNGLMGWIMLRQDGEKPRKVGLTYLAVDELQWHPFEEQIAYIGYSKAIGQSTLPRTSDLYLLNLNNDKVIKLTHTGDISRFSLDWSPDGKYIAFATGVGIFKTLEVIEISTGKRHVLLQAEDFGSNGASRISSIRWSPNGRSIVFDIWTKYESSGPVDIGCISWPELRFTRLTDDGNSRWPCWSPDSKRVYFVKKSNMIWSVTPYRNQDNEVYMLDKVD